MRVLVTGGTGFVGPAIVRALLGAGHQVTLLVHRDAAPFDPPPPGLSPHHGDVTDLASLGGLGPHDAVVHLVAIRRGKPADFERMHVDATRHVLQAAKDVGARRFVHMSAHGVKPDGVPYQRTKHRAEELVKASGIAWTIFRPTFITGPPEGDAVGADQEFADMARSTPFMPDFGDFALQPVAKRDVAQAFLAALERDAAIGQTYALAGPDKVTWKEYIRTIEDVIGKPRPFLPAPPWLILPVASVLGGLLPASHDELAMLVEGHTPDGSPAARDLGVRYTPWRTALEEALAAPRGSRTRRTGTAAGG
jgi:uncharacterized protein YbjT (DUF2867 family)